MNIEFLTLHVTTNIKLTSTIFLDYTKTRDKNALVSY